MYYVTYQFNETVIVTVTVSEVNIGTDYANFLDRKGDRHVIPADSILSVLPVRHVRRRSTTPKKD